MCLAVAVSIALAVFANMMLQNWAPVALTVGTVLASPIACATDEFKAKCASIASTLKIENATVNFSEFVAAGTNMSIPDRNATCGVPYQVISKDICRIALYVATSSSSGINMEAFLP